MRRTLKLLSIVGVAAAAGVAAVRRIHPEVVPEVVDLSPSNVSQELRQALSRFEERFGT